MIIVVVSRGRVSGWWASHSCHCGSRWPPHVAAIFTTCCGHVYHMWRPCLPQVAAMFTTCGGHVYHMWWPCLPHVVVYVVTTCASRGAKDTGNEGVAMAGCFTLGLHATDLNELQTGGLVIRTWQSCKLFCGRREKTVNSYEGEWSIETNKRLTATKEHERLRQTNG